MMHGNVWKRLWTDRAMAAVAISQMTCAGSEGGGSQGEGQEVTGGRSPVGGGGGSEHQRSGSHHAVEHQSLDDGAKPAHQLLDLRGAGRRVGNVLDDQQGVPADRGEVLLWGAQFKRERRHAFSHLEDNNILVIEP